MAIRKIVKIGDDCLRQECRKQEKFDLRLKILLKDMADTMYKAEGVGLAAPQVGVLSRLFVMDCEKDPDAPRQPIAMLNPEITWRSEALNTYEEGCLSIPDQYADVTRPAEVKVRWMGLDGKPQEEHFAGHWATCVQHEIDHLNGRLFIDYLTPLKRQLITRKMEKLKRERARL